MCTSRHQVYSFDSCSVKPGFREQREAKTIVELIPNSKALLEGRRRNPSIVRDAIADDRGDADALYTLNIIIMAGIYFY